MDSTSRVPFAETSISAAALVNHAIHLETLPGSSSYCKGICGSRTCNGFAFRSIPLRHAISIDWSRRSQLITSRDAHHVTRADQSTINQPARAVCVYVRACVCVCFRSVPFSGTLVCMIVAYSIRKWTVVLFYGLSRSPLTCSDYWPRG